MAMNDAEAKEKEDVKALYEKPIAKVGLWGHIELAPKVSEIMGWRLGTELTGQKVDGLLILQQFRPKCCVCGSTDQLKEVRDMFLCQRCIDAADEQAYYPYKGKILDE